MTTVRAVPQRSAIAPANGWVAPHSRFWIAMASAKVSRPQPRSRLIGCRNRPKLERMPNDSRTTSDPQVMAISAARVSGWDTDSVLLARALDEGASSNVPRPRSMLHCAQLPCCAALPGQRRDRPASTILEPMAAGEDLPRAGAGKGKHCCLAASPSRDAADRRDPAAKSLQLS